MKTIQMRLINITILNRAINYIGYTVYIAVYILEENIKQIVNADLNRKYQLSWELINEITGRKTTQKGMIKGKNQK